MHVPILRRLERVREAQAEVRAEQREPARLGHAAELALRPSSARDVGVEATRRRDLPLRAPALEELNRELVIVERADLVLALVEIGRASCRERV